MLKYLLPTLLVLFCTGCETQSPLPPPQIQPPSICDRFVKGKFERIQVVELKDGTVLCVQAYRCTTTGGGNAGLVQGGSTDIVLECGFAFEGPLIIVPLSEVKVVYEY